MLSIIVSTIAYFVAAYFIKRYLDEADVPKSATRALVIFVLALAIAYGVAFVVDWLAELLG
jgi:Na+/proline symporter